MAANYFIKLLLLLISIRMILSTEIHCNRTKLSCGCGPNPIGSSLRIVNGISTSPESWPMIVSLKSIVDKRMVHHCAGTIVNQWFILTAAHCVDMYRVEDLKMKRLLISAGSHNRTSSNLIFRYIDRIIIHSEWTVGSQDYRYDIALLHLLQPLNFIENLSIMRTCLPSTTMNFDEMIEYPSNGTSLMVIGWGRLGTYDNDTDHLQQASVYAMDHRDRICQNSIYDPTIQFCAGTYQGNIGSSKK